MKKQKTFNDIFVKNSMDIPFLLILLVILTIGLVMLLSASYFNAFYNTASGDSLYYFKRQLIFSVFGVISMLVLSRVNYKYFRLLGLLGMGVSLLLLVAVLLIPNEEDDGIKRWIYLGSFQFQPSEIAKFMLIVFLANGLDRDNKKLTSSALSPASVAQKIYKYSNKRILITQGTTTLFKYAVAVLVVAGLVALESHLSGTILMLGIGVVMLWLGEGRARWFAIAGIGGALVITLFVVYIEAKNFQDIPFLKPYMVERIQSWLDKDFSPLDKRWQTNQSLYAIGSGGLLGSGLGNSKEKYLYVSEPQNDFIFAIVCEELGFVGAVGILLLYALLIVRGLYIGMRSRDRFGALLVFGMISQLALQVFLNVGVVSDLLPNTGIGLPFFSYGGTSMCLCLWEMGVVLAVSRQANLPKVYSFSNKTKKAKAV